jgi:addiction module RelB/DinJ family antitoxin
MDDGKGDTNSDHGLNMSRVIRSAMLSMRVTPGVKDAAEDVLCRLGLNMTEAMELFLRRLIVDQRIPFEVVSLDNATYKRLVDDWPKTEHEEKRPNRTSNAARRTS